MDRYWRIFLAQPETVVEGTDPITYFDQKARRLEIQGGALVFGGGAGQMIVAVSPSHWSTVEEIGADEAQVDE